MAKNLPSTLKRLFNEYIRHYVARLIAAFIFLAVSSVCTAGLAKLLQPVIDDVFTAQRLDRLYMVSGVVFATFLIRGLTQYGASVLLMWVGQRVIADVQSRLFQKLIYQDIGFFHKTTSGQLIAHFINDTTLLRSIVSSTLINIGRDFLTLIALVGVMFYQDWFLASIAFIVFPVAIWPIIKIGRRMRKLSGSTQDQVGILTSFLNQIFRAIPVVKLYGQEQFEIKRAYQVINEVFQLTYKAIRVRSSSHPITEVLGGLAVVLGISYGGWQVIHGHQTTGTFISFIAALIMAYEPVKRLANLNANLQEGTAAADRLFKIMNATVDVQDHPQAKAFKPLNGTIEFKNVTFQYEPEKKILDPLSLKVPGGKVVALVGPSGGGKTTVLNLIPRFYDIQGGQILIDEQDIAHVTLNSLRQNIAAVSQDIVLFHDTVRNNIAYGYPDAPLEDIIRCAQDAAAHEFIMELPQQYDTPIGEHGLRLSGGQRQRLAIARALFKNAPILLLDEATSALDSQSEHQVQEALRRLMQGRTTVVIAHRLATIQNADWIFVINQGRVVEQGTHQTLLDQNGMYTQLYQQYAVGSGERP